VSFALATSMATVLLAAAPGSEARSACGPAAILEGGQELVASIGAALTEHRVATSAPEGCPAVRVQLGRHDRAIAVTIQDAYGRRVERQLSSIAAAGALIESWAMPLFVIEIGPGPLEDSAPPVLATEARAPPTRRRSLALAGVFETAYAIDGSIWVGGSAGGCVLVGMACTGLLARFASMRDQVRQSQERDEVAALLSRQELEGLLTAAVPIQAGRLGLWPGLGVGLGWLRGTDHTGVTPPATGQQLAARLDLSLTASLPLGRDFSLAALLAAQGSFVSSARAVESKGPKAGESQGATVQEGDSAKVAQPAVVLRFGLGLRWGAR
jgi:hypothetical protein